MASLREEPYLVAIEVVNRRCRGMKALKDLGIQQYILKDVRSLPGGQTRHLIRIPSRRIKEIPKDTFTKMNSSEKSIWGASAWFDSKGCDVCNTIMSQNSFLISGRHIEGYAIVYSFVAPSFAAFKRVVSTLESKGLKLRILEMAKFKPRGKVLTEKQERVLWVALKMGFFEFPRKITMQELSHRLGISLSTLSEIIRRGTRRLMKSHLEA